MCSELRAAGMLGKRWAARRRETTKKLITAFIGTVSVSLWAEKRGLAAVAGTEPQIN